MGTDDPYSGAARGAKEAGVPVIEETLIGYCGLYCGACPHYRASFPAGAHLLAAAAREGRAMAGYACRGCRSDSLYIHPGCAACRIRACAQAKGLPHCGSCAEMPCHVLLAFREDGHAHHLEILRNLVELNRIGPGEWLTAQEKRWRCSCGMAFSWYERSCHSCGRVLVAYLDEKETNRDWPGDRVG